MKVRKEEGEREGERESRRGRGGGRKKTEEGRSGVMSESGDAVASERAAD